MLKPPQSLITAWVAIGIAPICGSGAEGAPAFRQVYIGGIGHFGTPYSPKTSLEAVGMTIAQFSDDSVIIRGKDDAGNPWIVITEVSGGVGFSESWHGDLDANGRADLIVLKHFPKNGKCPNDPRLTVVMIDASGRPVPWEIDSNVDLRHALGEPRFDIASPPSPPPGIAEFVDLNGNQRAEFVQTECFDGETSIRAIYEVEGARWRQVSTSAPHRSTADYADALRGLRFPPVPAPAERYFIDEIANAIEGARPAVITARIARQGTCYGISLPPFVNGGMSGDPRDAKAEAERNYRACNDGFVLDDGRACFGYPAIVIDRPAGREAQAVGKSPEAGALLDELVEGKTPVVLTGQTDEDHCSPAVIWALDE